MKQTTWTDIPLLALPSACQGAFFQAYFVEKAGAYNMAFHGLSTFFTQSFPPGFHDFYEVLFLLYKNTKLSFAEEQLATKKGLEQLFADFFSGAGFRKIYSQIKSIIVLKLKNSPMGQITALCDYLN